MKNFWLILYLMSFMAACNTKSTSDADTKKAAGPITLVIHGGAGTIRKEDMSPEKEAAYHAALKQALEAGYSILDSGGTSVDAVIAAIKVMEDSPLFNAGRGAVFTNEGKNELDASIMDGSTLMAGAVAGVTRIRNPITAAHAVMTRSQHVMLVGSGAEQFAEREGLELVDPSYFYDSTRYKQLLRLQEREKAEGNLSMVQLSEDPFIKASKFGTVGAVALDKAGNIAAGTSTGGMSNKRFGRVGDAPIIGAGTYANNATCGISATGWGEYFIRLSVARDIAAMMEYTDASINEAAENVIMKKLPDLGGDGGVVGLDRAGNVTMTFNTDGMYRGYLKEGEAAKTFIYKDDK